MKTRTRAHLERKGVRIQTFGYGMTPSDQPDQFGSIGGSAYYVLPNGDVYKKVPKHEKNFEYIGKESDFQGNRSYGMSMRG